MTHWRKIHTTDHLSATELDGTIEVTIKSVTEKKVEGEKGRKQNLPVAELEGMKPMILNRTNCKVLHKLSGSPNIEDWGGMTVTITIEKVNFKGDVVDGLRIVPVLPKKKIDTAPYIAQINGCENEDQLKGIWLAMGKDIQSIPQILAAKDKKKSEFQK